MNSKSLDKLSTDTDHSSRTGLLREQSFFDRASDVLESEATGPWCLIAIDLDHFKLFNEWYGREEGDQILAEIGARIAKEAAETGGVGGYFGSDDFRLIAPYDRQRVNDLFDDISDLMADHGADAGFMPVFGISVTIGATPILELNDQAVIASNNAKSDFRKRICMFRPQMHDQEEKEYRILSSFMHGLESGEIYFQLQPQCKASTGKIVGAEALARWRKADGTLIPPNEFVPVLEQHGFITRLDSFIWEEVCAWIRSWIDRGHATVPISVNVSQVDFYVIDVVACFEELIRKYRLTPQHLKIEVTESAYVSSTALIVDATSRLRKKGFLVFMDDFGSGYSSLNTLRSLDLDVIKLDAKLINIAKGEERKGVHILESVINMAKSLSMPMISEGVETNVQSEFLQGQGCLYVQGFLYYHPMDVAQFEEIIADEQIIDDDGFVVERAEHFKTSDLLDKHVYSESMMNAILGAVALFSWHDDDVDIIRFNDVFQDTINSDSIFDHLQEIQKLMPPNEAPKLFALMTAAQEDQLHGSSDLLRFSRLDGSISSFLCHFYYLGERDDSKRFYGSIRDITDILAEHDAQA